MGITDPLFFKDTGSLELEARRVLVKLLKGPSVDASRHPKLWQALLKYQRMIESRLSELFLQLIVDQDMQVAFCRQADTGDLEVPSLLRQTKVAFLGTVLLLYLRKRLTESSAKGERAIITAAEMGDHLRLFEKANSTDKAGFEKRINNGIEHCKKYAILQEMPGGETRYEISPTLKLLFSVEEIQGLQQRYQTILSQ